MLILFSEHIYVFMFSVKQSDQRIVSERKWHRKSNTGMLNSNKSRIQYYHILALPKGETVD